MELEKITDTMRDWLLPSTLRQGHLLLEQGAVRALEVRANGSIDATILDGRREYAVEIVPAPHGATLGNCTCHVGFLCKHVATVLCALEDPDGRFVDPRVHDRLIEGKLDAWLDRVAGQAAPPAPAKRDTSVVYILEPAAFEGILDVRVQQARPKKRGGWARPTPLSTDHVRQGRGARCVTPDDERLIMLLWSMTRPRFGDRFQLEERMGTLLLEIVRTGRCFAFEIGGDPLVVGAERRGEPAWSIGDDGTQHPMVRVEGGGVAFLFDQPLWGDDSAIGPLEPAIPVASLRAFESGPPLPPEASARIPAAVQQRIRKLGLPPPEPLEVVERPAGEPRGGLACYSAEIARPNGNTAIVDAVQPRIRYGDHIVLAADLGESIVTRSGRTLERLKRDLAGEAELLAELEPLGFFELGSTVPHGWDPAFDEFERRHRAHLDLTLNARLGEVDVDAWRRFAEQDVPRLRAAGWEIEFTPEFRFGYVTPTRIWANVRASSGVDWFDLELGVEIGDGQRIDLTKVLRGLLDRSRSARHETIETEVDGTKLRVPVDRLRRIASALIEFSTGEGEANRGRLGLLDTQIATLADLEGCVDDLDWGEAAPFRDLAHRLADFDGMKPIAAPKSCRAKLRKYQREGLAWLQFLREFGLNGILADDMGLGKTVQVLGHLLVERAGARADRPSLVIAPTSVATNWVAEAARFAPSLDVVLWHGADRAERSIALDAADVIVTTYALALRDADVLGAREYHLLVLDEAQAIKNAQSKVRRALRGLEARHRLCLTGTPLENNLAELWSQFDFLMPGFLGNARSFGRSFRTPVERHDDDFARNALLRRIRPFVLRRTKDQVLRQLPPKTEIAHQVELGPAQRDLYESIRVAMQERVQQAIDDTGLNRAQIVILDALLKLRQVCCDSRLVKLDAARDVHDSAKLDELMALLTSLLADGRRVLLFSQFTSMLTLIEERLRDAKIDWVKLTGATRNRQQAIARFQDGEVPLFLISLKAGGTGLNLTAADTVIHYDPWWNPAVERQATDRAHRIGQDKPVFVYRMIVANSVEEKIAQLQQRKRALFDGIVEASGTASAAKLTKRDVEMLFG